MKTIGMFITMALCLSSMQHVAAQESLEDLYKRTTKMANEHFPGDRLDFSASWVDGTPMSYDELKGTNVFYLFGGSTCGPCIGLGKVMTLLVREKKYDPKDVKFVLVTDDDAKGRQILTDRFEIDPGIMVCLSADKHREIGVTGDLRPLIVFVDRDSNVVFKSVGFSSGPNGDMDIARQQFELMFGLRIEELLEKQAKMTSGNEIN